MRWRRPAAASPSTSRAACAAQGFRYLVTEEFAATPGTVDEGYGAFPARFGNLYTARQLRQLIDRAYGMFRPQARAWALPGGGVADPFRPRIQAGGFPDLARWKPTAAATSPRCGGCSRPATSSSSPWD